MSKWQYIGDVNLECGGFYWREDGADDYVLAVDITPCSDAGGPDNLFHIAHGSIFVGNDSAIISSALDTIGETIESASRLDIVYAMRAYRGLDGPDEYVVQIGKAQESSCNGWNPAPDKILRSNASLRRYVERNFLCS